MNPLEAQLTYPLGETVPDLGTALDVAPGVRWLRMKLPFALDHVNLWLLRDAATSPEGRDEPVQGWTVVDCGVANDETRAAWRRVFAECLDGLPVLRVLVTHMHPDHIGLAHWLTERWNARLWISATDHGVARWASQGSTAAGRDDGAAFMASHGLRDAAALEKFASRPADYAGLVPQVPERFHRLLDGETLEIGSGSGRARWQCLVGHGHAPEHISLHRRPLPAAAEGDAGVLISGDMVLPRISTNVSVTEHEPEADPLRLYLDSIRRLRALPADTLVLPSHGRPFVGLHTRIEQLTAHHDERFAEVVAACDAAPQTAADLLPVLFRRRLDSHQTTFAMGEALAHLHALWHAGKLVRRVGSDGVHRFGSA